MQIKSIAMMMIAGCAIGMLTGCGVPQEEYDAMVAQLTTEKETAVNELQTKLDDSESLLNAEKARTTSLNGDLRDSTVLNDELKQANAELKDNIADLNSSIEDLQSQVATARAQIRTAQDRAASADTARNQAEMEAQRTQRRYDELVANLLELNKKKPENLAFLNLSDMVQVPEEQMNFGESDTSAASLLDEMGDL